MTTLTYPEIVARWNAQADSMNQWDSLGEDEKIEWAVAVERERCAELMEKQHAWISNVAASRLIRAQAVQAREAA